MSISSKMLGDIGEDLAVNFLTKKGYEIISRNFRCPLGEIDIVARDRGAMAFIEVKCRSSAIFGLPQEAVDFKKRRKLAKLALFFIACHNISSSGMRFDVVSIMINKFNNTASIELERNAF